MDSYVTDTQALVKFMMGKKVNYYIPEMHDRFIAATALYLDLPLITNDLEIRESGFVSVLE